MWILVGLWHMIRHKIQCKFCADLKPEYWNSELCPIVCLLTVFHDVWEQSTYYTTINSLKNIIW